MATPAGRWPLPSDERRRILNHDGLYDCYTGSLALDVSMSAAQVSIPQSPAQSPAASVAALALAGRLTADTATMLATGGDSRIAFDPATLRNRYGTRTTPSIGEIGNASMPSASARSMSVSRAPSPAGSSSCTM